MTDERVETGEWGFCETCGEVAAVVVTPNDRLQARLVRAAMARREKPVGGFFGDLQEELGRMGTQAIEEGARDAVLFGLTMPVLVTFMTGLILLEAAMNEEEGGKPVDLLREATELLEARLEGGR